MLDRGSGIGDAARLAERELLQQALVRPVAVIVRGLFGQYSAEMLSAEDQHVVQALAAKRSREPLRERVRPRRLDRRPDHLRAVPSEDLVERRSELAVPVADQEPEPPCPLAGVHHQVSGLLGCPGPSPMSGHAQDVHGLGLDLPHEQHVRALQ